MTLPGQSRAANIKDSWKRFLNVNLRTETVYVAFDNSLAQPSVQGRPMEKWVTIRIGQFVPGTLSDQIVEFYCCTRRDAEGYKCAQLRDTVYELLTDIKDAFKRIPLYRSHPTAAWVEIGKILIHREWIRESGEVEGPDDTKIRTLTVRTRFASGL